ncbi:TetR/AcrR family transcriptional regulator [Ethanoligenens sp.]|uniref:TetR/AcrR family transcriptional regulator n=1 Tax=Ethanoligenens sp. TaxID=2099655 RepID=UPI0039E8564F
MDVVANKRQHPSQIQQNIFQIALELFRTAGYEATTIQDICEKADVSVGAFYYYYKSKEDILNDSYRECDHLLDEKYGHVVFDDPITGILEILSSMSQSIQEQGFRVPAQFYKNQIIATDRFILRQDRSHYRLIYRLVEQALACGQLNTDDSPQTIVDTIMRVARGVLYDWCLHDGAYDPAYQIRADIQIVLRYFQRKDI